MRKFRTAHSTNSDRVRKSLKYLESVLQLLVIPRIAILNLSQELRQLDDKSKVAGAFANGPILITRTCTSGHSANQQQPERGGQGGDFMLGKLFKLGRGTAARGGRGRGGGTMVTQRQVSRCNSHRLSTIQTCGC